MSLSASSEEILNKVESFPGSDIKVESAVKEADTVVIASAIGQASVLDRNTYSISYSLRNGDMADGDVITNAKVQQQFKISKLLSGSPKTGEITLEYTYVEQSERKHAGKAIEISADQLIICIKDTSVVKVLPATKENIDLVRKLIDESKKP